LRYTKCETCILCLGLLQDGDVGVGAFAECEKTLVGNRFVLRCRRSERTWGPKAEEFTKTFPVPPRRGEEIPRVKNGLPVLASR